MVMASAPASASTELDGAPRARRCCLGLDGGSLPLRMKRCGRRRAIMEKVIYCLPCLMRVSSADAFSEERNKQEGPKCGEDRTHSIYLGETGVKDKFDCWLPTHSCWLLWWRCLRLPLPAPLRPSPRQMPELQIAADGARSRKKTNLPAQEGDEDLVLYYYLVMHPNTDTGRDLRITDGKAFRDQVIPRLQKKFPNEVQIPHWCVPKEANAA